MLRRSSRLRAAALLAMCLLTVGAQAQNARIRGFVTDASDGESLLGVNVFLLNLDGGLVTGAASDGNGYFDLPQIQPGRYVLRATFVGYAPFADTIDAASGAIVTNNIALRPSAETLDEVVVEGEREAGAAAVTAGLQTVRVRDIERVPTPDVSGDLAGYLQALPGVVSTGDRGGQLFVRGGTSTQNLSLIDGVPLYQPFHIVGFYSAFPADIISKVDVYAGGFGARFGGRLSSVIDVSTRDGNKQRFRASVSAAPFLTSGQLEGPIWKGRVSILASVRESFIEQTGPVLLNQELPYKFGDRFLKIHALPSQNSRLSVIAIRTFDRGVLDPLRDRPDFGFDEEDEAPVPGSDQVQWLNESYGIRYLVLPANIPVLTEILFSTSRLRNTFGLDSDPDRVSEVSEFNGSVNLNYYLRRADVGFGFFVHGSTLSYDLGGIYQGFTSNDEYLTEAGAYVEAALRMTRSLTVTPGLRLHSFPSVGGLSLEPRFRAVWRPGGEQGRHQLSGAMGLYRQEIVGLQDRRDAGDVFTAWTSSPLAQEIPSAIHYIGGYQLRATSWLELSAEGFYKTLSDLVVPEWSAFPAFATRLQSADGYVAGADFRIEVDRPWGYGFVSYGISRVEYRAHQTGLDLWYGADAVAYNPPHDRRHQVNALLGTTVLGLDLNVRWQLGSGLPFSQAVGFDNWVAMVDSRVDVRSAQGNARVIYGPPYRGRLPSYHRLDVSIDRTFEPSPHLGITVQGSLINVYDRTNLFYFDLFTLRRVDQLPLIPSFGLKIEIK